MSYEINGVRYQSVLKCLSALKIPSNGFFRWYRDNSSRFSTKEEGLQYYIDLVANLDYTMKIPFRGIAKFECKVCKCKYVFTRELAFKHIEECCNGNSRLIRHCGWHE